jgi:protease I
MTNDTRLAGKKVAVLVAHGFEQVEMTEPVRALRDAGAKTEIVSPEPDSSVRGWRFMEWGDAFPIDLPLYDAHARAFDALLLPGGVMNPDRLRVNPAVPQFVRSFATAGKPIAAICHAPWTLINADLAQGRTLTSWPSLRRDLENAGAHWVDQEVVVDDGIITSRKPDDIPAFNRAVIEQLAAVLEPSSAAP